MIVELHECLPGMIVRTVDGNHFVIRGQTDPVIGDIKCWSLRKDDVVYLPENTSVVWLDDSRRFSPFPSIPTTGELIAQLPKTQDGQPVIPPWRKNDVPDLWHVMGDKPVKLTQAEWNYAALHQLDLISNAYSSEEVAWEAIRSR